MAERGRVWPLAWRALVVLCALWRAMPAAADCLAWSDASLQVVHGVVDAVPGAGTVAYRIGYGYAGFNHHAGMVEIRWTAGGRTRRQLLFHGMHDRPPATLARTGEGLALSVQYCEHGADTCQTLTAAFAYDPDSNRFRGADPAADALASGCGTDAAE